jgi:hypothetical protein
MHSRDRQWVPPSQVPAFTFWNDDSLDVLSSGERGESEVGVRLLRVGGHFPGSAVALVGPQVGRRVSFLGMSRRKKDEDE